MVIVVAALWPLTHPIMGVGDTFQFWFAGHLVATGISPYDRSAWTAAESTYGPRAANVAMACADPDSGACSWVYPPATGWLLAPFGAAGVDAGLPAVDGFVLATAFVGVITAVLLFGPVAAGARALVLVTVVASHPFVYDVHVGHFIGLELLGVVGVAYGLRERRDWPLVLGGLVLSLTPHLFIILVPLVAVALVARRRWRAITLCAAALAALVVAGALLEPAAFPTILQRAGPKAGLTWSTPWALAQLVAPTAPLVLYVALVGLAALAAIAVWRTAPPEDRDLALIAAGTGLSLTATPYAQPYDLLLLVPAIAFIARAASRSRAPHRAALLATLPILYVGGTWFPLIATRLWEDSNSALALVPVVVLALAAVASATARPRAIGSVA
jgi:hypothetical protein